MIDVRRMVTPNDGRPLIDPRDFARMRRFENKRDKVSECCFERQTGRTTRIVLEACEIVCYGGHPIILTHDMQMREHVQLLVMHYSKYFDVVSSQVWVETHENFRSGHCRGREFDHMLVDNCVIDMMTMRKL